MCLTYVQPDLHHIGHLDIRVKNIYFKFCLVTRSTCKTRLLAHSTRSICSTRLFTRSTRLSTRSTRLSTCSTRFSTRSTRLSIRSTCLSTFSTRLFTRSICLSSRSTHSTIRRSFYNWSYVNVKFQIYYFLEPISYRNQSIDLHCNGVIIVEKKKMKY